MAQYKDFFVQGTAADLYLFTGFIPGAVFIQSMTTDSDSMWWHSWFNTVAIARSDAGDAAQDTDAISLVTFTDSREDTTSAPSDVEAGKFYLANGIRIDAGVDCIANAQHNYVQVFEMTTPVIRGYHDGTTSSNTYFEDSSIDFLDAGLNSKNVNPSESKWIIINETNDNYAWCGKVTKPSGKANYCRIYTYEDSACATATAAADFDTNDECFILRESDSQYPLSGIGLMT